jgi:hypothetical protein
MSTKRARWPIAVGAIAAAAHLALCLAVSLGAFAGEGSWSWFIPFIADFPASILFLPFQGHLPNLLVFGTLGSAWWFLIGWGLARLVARHPTNTQSSRSGQT